MKIFTLLFALYFTATGAVMAETNKQTIPTYGVHHFGLTVKDLKTTSDFFINALEFKQVGGKPDYPSIFVSDGHVMVTLWQANENASDFDRKDNIGLHHMAFKLNNFDDLYAMHEKIKDWPGVKIEFSPEHLGDRPAKHMMFYEPGGIRLEFIVVPE